MKKILTLIVIILITACSNNSHKVNIEKSYSDYKNDVKNNIAINKIIKKYWCKKDANRYINLINSEKANSIDYLNFLIFSPNMIKHEKNILKEDNCLLVSGYKEDNEAMSLNLLYEQEDGKAKICHVHINIGKFDETPNCKPSED